MTAPRTTSQQINPLAHTGGMGFDPVAGIMNGVDVTAVSFSGSNISLTVTAGTVRIDGNVIAVPAGSYTITTPYALTTDTLLIRPGIVPTRKVPAVTTLPTSSTAGDRVILVTECSSGATLTTGYVYHEVLGYYEYDGSVWQPLKLSNVKDNVKGYNCHPFTEIIPTITAANFSYRPELYIYPRVTSSPGIPAIGTGSIRVGAFIQLAALQFAGGVMTNLNANKQVSN